MEKSPNNITHIHTLFKNWQSLFDPIYFDVIELLTDIDLML